MDNGSVKLTVILSALVFGGTWLALSPDGIQVQVEPFYQNCSAARAAGAAPLERGEPGYRYKVDADNDGLACELYRR